MRYRQSLERNHEKGKWIELRSFELDWGYRFDASINNGSISCEDVKDAKIQILNLTLANKIFCLKYLKYDHVKLIKK